MKKIIVFILILFSTLLFAQTKQELTEQLNAFFVEERIVKIEEFIKRFDNSLSFNLQNDTLIIYDTFSETSYERFFEVSRLLNFVRFYLEDFKIQPEDLEINFIIYSFNNSNVVTITKEFLIKYYLANSKEQIELIGNLF